MRAWCFKDRLLMERVENKPTIRRSFVQFCKSLGYLNSMEIYLRFPFEKLQLSLNPVTGCTVTDSSCISTKTEKKTPGEVLNLIGAIQKKKGC